LGVVFACAFGVTAAFAQTGLGGLRGTIIDSQGGALPGVTVTATSPEMLGPQTAVTNERGEYRLINLPPGTFTIVAELARVRHVPA
jgi:protocatechuate 3,4-dioxygenase beta subunit